MSVLEVCLVVCLLNVFSQAAVIHKDVKSTQITKVHIVFMNHLDVGYADGIDQDTGFIVQVLNRYMTEYFVRAINISRTLIQDGYTEKYVYTTHPWLVSLYLDCPNITLIGGPLKCPSEEEQMEFRRAVSDGLISWHAFPFNIQTDFINYYLFESGLELSQRLDAMFHIKRTHPTMSQRDVPGITKAALASLKKYGIKAVSVGVNPGTAPPDVPSPFVWKFSPKDEDGIMAFWVKGGYPLNPGPNPAQPGGLSRDKCVIADGLSEILCFAFRTDNTGPPVTIQEVLGYYEILRAEFPGAQLVASTFDNFVQALETVKSTLPVRWSEIGDTWIQGVASDPWKYSRYRAFVRAWENCEGSYRCNRHTDPRIQNMLRYLVKIPEHTWGSHGIIDFIAWTNEALEAARQTKPYQINEDTWREQRQFLDLALTALGDHPLVQSVQNEYEDLVATEPDLSEYTEASPDQDFYCPNGGIIRFASDGSLIRLYDPFNKVFSVHTFIIKKLKAAYMLSSSFDFISVHPNPPQKLGSTSGVRKRDNCGIRSVQIYFLTNEVKRQSEVQKLSKTCSQMEKIMVEPSSVNGRDFGLTCSGREPEGMECVTMGMLTRLQAELEALKLACQRPHYVIEPAGKMKQFSGDGRNDEISIEDFVREIRDLWELRPYLSPQEKTATILVNIGGPARVEVDLQPPQVRSDPEALLDALMFAFEKVVPVREAEITFLKSQQRRSESLLEFSHRLFKEFTMAIRQEKREGIDCFKEERLRDQYAYGVQDLELRRELFRFIAQHPQTSFQELRKYAFKLENQNKEAAGDQEHSFDVLSAKLTKLEKQLEEIEGDGYDNQPCSINSLSSQLRPTRRQTKHNQQSRNRQTAPPGLVWTRTKRGFFPYTDNGSPVCTKCWEAGHVGRQCPPSSQLAVGVQSVCSSEPIASQPTHQVVQRASELRVDATYTTCPSFSKQALTNRDVKAGQPSRTGHDRFWKTHGQKREYKQLDLRHRLYYTPLRTPPPTASQTSDTGIRKDLRTEEKQPCITYEASQLQSGKMFVVPDYAEKKQLFPFQEEY